MNGVQPVTLVIILVGGCRIGQLIGTARIAQKTHIFHIRTTFSYPIESFIDIGYLKSNLPLVSTYQKILRKSLITNSINEINKIKEKNFLNNFLYKLS